MNGTAGIYLRVSNDDGRAGESQTIESQRRECTAYAERLGLSVVEYVDDGFSASKIHVERPAWTELQEDMAAGTITHVIAAKQDRLSRITRVWAEFATLAVMSQVEVHTVEAGNLNLESDAGLLNTDIRSAFAAFEARLIGSRTKRGLETSRNLGKWTNTATFGYDRGGIVNEEQAKWVRWAYDQILEQGASTRSVFEAFRSAGVKTARGNEFYSVGNLIAMLKNPALAGLITYKGEIIQPVDPKTGQPVTAEWVAIVTPEERDRLIAAISARATSARGHGKRSARKYALSGLVLCGNPECTTYLRVMAAQNPGNGRNHYFYCDPRRDGCRNRVKGKELDAIAQVVAMRLLSIQKAPAQALPTPFDSSEMEDVEREIAETRSLAVSGKLRASDASAILSGLNERLDSLRAEKAEHDAATETQKSWHRAQQSNLMNTDHPGRFRGVIENVQALPNGGGFIFESVAGHVHKVSPSPEGGWQIF